MRRSYPAIAKDSELMPWKIDRLDSRIKGNDVASVVILQEIAQMKDEELHLGTMERTMFS